MPETHIILYTTTALARGSFAPSAKGLQDQEIKYQVQFENIDAGKAAELAQANPEIVATAPSIPLKLISPLEDEASDIKMKEEDDIAWGVRAVNAHKSQYTGKGITVAILDTGIDRNHESFTHIPSRKLVEKDFTNDGNGDVDGHGTHVAGTVFGRTTDGIRIGVAPGITDVLIGKVLGKKGGSTEMLWKAIDWASKKGANIISMSLGIDFPGYVAEMVARGMKAQPASSLALEAYRKNIILFEKLSMLIRAQSMGGHIEPLLVIAAAGNESKRPEYSIAVSPPAVSDGIMSVGALGRKDSNYAVADFSNTGPVLSGPGVSILSSKAGGGLVYKNGTSMATPHVAGVAALWAERLKAKGQFKLDQLIANLTATCTDEGLENEKPTDYGAGMVQAPK